MVSFLFTLCTATVHLPRIGHTTPGFNWYGTERLIRKHLASRGIPTSMYPLSFSRINEWRMRVAVLPGSYCMNGKLV